MGDLGSGSSGGLRWPQMSIGNIEEQVRKKNKKTMLHLNIRKDENSNRNHDGRQIIKEK